jgi:hypothetical protein
MDAKSKRKKKVKFVTDQQAPVREAEDTYRLAKQVSFEF